MNIREMHDDTPIAEVESQLAPVIRDYVKADEIETLGELRRLAQRSDHTLLEIPGFNYSTIRSLHNFLQFPIMRKNVTDQIKAWPGGEEMYSELVLARAVEVAYDCNAYAPLLTMLAAVCRIDAANAADHNDPEHVKFAKRTFEAAVAIQACADRVAEILTWGEEGETQFADLCERLGLKG